MSHETLLLPVPWSDVDDAVPSSREDSFMSNNQSTRTRLQTLMVFGYAMVSCLAVNDFVKVMMIKWRVPAAVA